MKAYSIFDDLTQEAIDILESAGIEIHVHPLGIPRPDSAQMKSILETHECVMIGTSQKISEEMFESINTPRIIATASVGVDHIKVPEAKKDLVTIINTPKANAQSVAEYTLGCALSCVKRFVEGNSLYTQGMNNKCLNRKPEDLAGKTIGVIGAGNISAKIMEYASVFGMNILCWTRNPDKHQDLKETGVCFADMKELVRTSDVISVNLPNNSDTRGFISPDLIKTMKETAVFISVSRIDTVDVNCLFDRAKDNPNFYVCLDIDVNDSVVNEMPIRHNIMVTPHIAGGTIETRKRMFKELAETIVSCDRNI